MSPLSHWEVLRHSIYINNTAMNILWNAKPLTGDTLILPLEHTPLCHFNMVNLLKNYHVHNVAAAHFALHLYFCSVKCWHELDRFWQAWKINWEGTIFDFLYIDYIADLKYKLNMIKNILKDKPPHCIMNFWFGHFWCTDSNVVPK